MILEVVALLMIVNGEIKEHRIQFDPETQKFSMSMCLKGKRVAMIWLMIMIIGAGYAVYRINKFADDVNPYNWFNRNRNDR